jgi:hypothetical protein
MNVGEKMMGTEDKLKKFVSYCSANEILGI